MVASTNRYTGSHLLLALIFGMLLGAFTEPIWMYLTDFGLPKDKKELAQKISRLESRIEDQMKTIAEQSNKITELTNDLNKSERAVKAARAETEQAKSATPRRYEVVKEGLRTWRLDTATGKTCLLLATDADWNKPDVAAQNCQLVQ
jgi:uncharacterized coiled-coil protein SlyX